MIRTLANITLLISVSYLGWRTIEQWLRQRRSYARLPFVDEPTWEPAASPLADRARGALAGIALGDALGAPRESLPPLLARLRYGSEPALSQGIIRFMRRPGAVTDDTQLTVLVAQAIQNGHLDCETLRASLLDWWSWRIGAGRGTERAIRALKSGGNLPLGSQGNGAAMRVAPLAIVFDDQDLGLAVQQSAELTHPNLEAIAGAEIIARATRLLLTEHSLSIELLLPTQTTEPARWEQLLTDALAGDADLGGDGWVFPTVAVSLSLWSRFGADYMTALRALYAAGGDTDTVGAIYLSLVGAAHGLSHFEPALIWRVQGIGVLIQEADRLLSSLKLIGRGGEVGEDAEDAQGGTDRGQE